MLTVISRSAEDVVLFTLFRIVQLYPFHVCRSVPSFLRRVHRGGSGDSYYQSIIDNRSCVFAKVTAMMRILAVAMALLAPAASFSFNGAPLRQSTSVSGTATLERQTVKSGARSMTMMPIGVPKVAYKMPGSRGGEWVDIYNRLTRERIIFMGAEIDDEMANQIIGVLLYLDNENPNQPIYLYINCPGGSVISGLAIYDTIQHIRSEVVTVNLGLAASMASFLLCAGSRGRRFALPHSRIMIHQPMGGAQGQAEDIRVEASQIMRIRNNLVKMYSLMTGQTTDQIVLDLDRDNFMSAEEALAYGLIDEIVQPNDEKIRQLSLPPPSQSPELFSEIPKTAIDYEFGKLNVARPRTGKPQSGGSYRR